MEITNKFGLPEFVVEALTFSDYSRGNAQISVTQLIDSPQVVQLQKEHEDKQTKDAVDFVWSRFGTRSDLRRKAFYRGKWLEIEWRYRCSRG